MDLPFHFYFILNVFLPSYNPYAWVTLRLTVGRLDFLCWLAEKYAFSPPTGAVIPLFHTGPESHELTRIDKYLDSWLNRTQFVKILTDSLSP